MSQALGRNVTVLAGPRRSELNLECQHLSLGGQSVCEHVHSVSIIGWKRHTLACQAALRELAVQRAVIKFPLYNLLLAQLPKLHEAQCVVDNVAVSDMMQKQVTMLHKV